MANKFRSKVEKEEIEELENVQLFEPTPSNTVKPDKKTKKGVLAKLLGNIFGGSFLSNDKAVQHLPFILFLGLMAILYIANGYYADDKIREVNKTSNQIKELRTEYISSKSDLMFVSKQSQVAKSVEKLKLKEPVTAPSIIEIEK